jgi:hypothetical protein
MTPRSPIVAKRSAAAIQATTMVEASPSRKVRKLLMPRAFVLLLAERSIEPNKVAIGRQYWYGFLLVPSGRCSSRKIAGCLEASNLQLRGSDRAGYRSPSRRAKRRNFRSSRSALRPEALTPAGSFWTRSNQRCAPSVARARQFSSRSTHQLSSKARVRYQCSSALPSGQPSRCHSA